MEDLVSVVQDNIAMEKLELNVRFHHGTFEKFCQMISFQFIISSVFKCYLILLSSGMNLFLLPSKTFLVLYILLFSLLIALALKLRVWMMPRIHRIPCFAWIAK